jgi:aldehyde:ferredoxin oxidoreductase
MSGELKGYAGKFLRADLTTGALTDVVFDEATLRSYLGGTGLGVKLVYDEVDPSSAWSDPGNRLIVASGPIGGTRISGSGTVSVVTKGALTGGIGAAQANGYFGAFLKFSGYDGVILQGRASRWQYLHIDEGKAELIDAAHLLGVNTYDIADRLKQEHGKTDFQASVLSIGVAGEHLVRFAGVFVDKGHAAGHNGTGAVMGSKRVKAIFAARGTGQVQVVDREALASVADQLYDRVKGFTGTLGGVYRWQTQKIPMLPVRNYTTNEWDISEEDIEQFSESHIRAAFNPKPHPCWACRLTHATMMTIPEGPYKGMVVEEPEYEQLSAWGSAIDTQDICAASMLSGETDRVGLENNEAGWLVGWVMECYEKGYLTKEELNGHDMTWGNADATRQLLYAIANRQGCGDWLAEGVMRASQKVGGAAARSAIYTMKGNTPRGHDHRTRWTELFETSVSNTGTLEVGGYMQNPKVMQPGYPEEVVDNLTALSGNMVFEDSLVTCRFNTGSNMPLLATAINAATGWDYTPEEGKTMGLRAINLMRIFNIKSGLQGMDYPSERYGSTPTDGPYKGMGIKPHWEDMLQRYYRQMGWDETGQPLAETLEALGLAFAVADLE